MKSVISVILFLFCLICRSQTTFVFSDSAVLARLSRDVHILASDSFAGRKSGSPGEQKAYQYITRAFQEAGLKPYSGADSSFLQSFPIESIRIPGDSNTLEIEGWQNPLIVQHDFSPTAYSANGRADGNKYLLVDLAQFRVSRENRKGGIRLSLRQVLRNAFRQGNSAVILYNERKLNGSEADSLYDRLNVSPEKGMVISVSTDIAAFLQQHPGVNLSIAVDIKRPGIICQNVVGFINNEAPTTVIIGAHYDHIGKNLQGKVFHGADDNASGTAVMMELARFLKQSGDRSNNYLFIAFSGEEEGLVGSGYFVKHTWNSTQTFNFMVNLDMVGRLGCESNVVTIFGTGSSPMWKKTYKETVHPAFRLSKMHGIHSFSDHLAFYNHGIPIISLTTGFHYDYHTTRDDASTINYTGMVDITRYLQGLLHNISSNGQAGFHKVSGWYNFSANFKIVIKGIDHLLSAGSDD